MQAESQESGETHVVIVGVGLIGGSIAAALRKRYPACRLRGIGRSSDRLIRAQQAGLIDDWSTEITGDAIPPASLSVVCLPVDRISPSVRELAAAAADDCVITDAGSVKSLMFRQLSDDPRAKQLFVGSHPIAGGEQTGFEFSQPDLFLNRVCVVTPEASGQRSVDRVAQFWRSLGSHVRFMSAAEHDQILARTSHLPHVLASTAAACVREDQLFFTGSGFRDTTRIAEGSADIWTGILIGNQEEVTRAIQQAQQTLQRIRTAVETRNAAELTAILESAAELRRQLGSAPRNPPGIP